MKIYMRHNKNSTPVGDASTFMKYGFDDFDAVQSDVRNLAQEEREFLATPTLWQNARSGVNQLVSCVIASSFNQKS